MCSIRGDSLPADIMCLQLSVQLGITFGLIALFSFYSPITNVLCVVSIASITELEQAAPIQGYGYGYSPILHPAAAKGLFCAECIAAVGGCFSHGDTHYVERGRVASDGIACGADTSDATQCGTTCSRAIPGGWNSTGAAQMEHADGINSASEVVHAAPATLSLFLSSLPSHFLSSPRRLSPLYSLLSPLPSVLSPSPLSRPVAPAPHSTRCSNAAGVVRGDAVRNDLPVQLDRGRTGPTSPCLLSQILAPLLYILSAT